MQGAVRELNIDKGRGSGVKHPLWARGHHAAVIRLKGLHSLLLQQHLCGNDSITKRQRRARTHQLTCITGHKWWWRRTSLERQKEKRFAIHLHHVHCAKWRKSIEEDLEISAMLHCIGERTDSHKSTFSWKLWLNLWITCGFHERGQIATSRSKSVQTLLVNTWFVGRAQITHLLSIKTADFWSTHF